MKTSAIKTNLVDAKIRRKNLIAGILFGLLIGVLLFTTVACDKKRDNNNVNRYGYGNGYGWGNPGYAGGGPTVGAALGNDAYGTLQLALEFQSVNNGYGYNGGYSYSGSVVAFGELYVGQPVQCNSLNGAFVNPGQYYIEPIQPGSINNGLISGMQMVAFGPGGELTLTISSATILPSYPKNYSCAGPQIFDELVGIFTIQSVNGFPCQRSVEVHVLGYPNMCY